MPTPAGATTYGDGPIQLWIKTVDPLIPECEHRGDWVAGRAGPSEPVSRRFPAHMPMDEHKSNVGWIPASPGISRIKIFDRRPGRAESDRPPESGIPPNPSYVPEYPGSKL